MLKKYLRINFIVIFFAIFGACFARGQVVNAVENTQAVDFSLEPLITNTNQISKGASYFDLLTQKGQKYQIQVKVYNQSKKQIKIHSVIHTGYTNGNGSIEYTVPAKTFDTSLKYKIGDIVKVSAADQVVTIPAAGSKVVTATVSMPTKNFTGVMAGGWYFEHADNTTKKSGVSNQYSYVVGIKLTENHEVVPTLKLKKVEPTLINLRRNVIANLQNPEAAILSQTKIVGKVYQKGSTKVLKSNTMENVTFAPNSNFDFPITWTNLNLAAGEYTLKLTATSQDPKFDQPKTWHFTKDFTITSTEAARINRLSVEKPPTSPWFYVAIGIAVTIGLLIVVGLIIWLVKRSKKSDSHSHRK